MSAARRGATGLAGVLAIDKPSGMTSHDVVSAIRRSTGERRIGHAGTLDPAATGLLVVLIGPATRLAPFLTSASKSYRARIAFGAQTDTDDADGAVIGTSEVPSALVDAAYAARMVAALVGDHLQVPPAYSAIKRGGTTAHRAARAGAPLDLEPRPVTVIDSRLVSVQAAPAVSWEIEVTVSKGTYVRALARDLGRSCGTVAHLAALRRLSSGNLTITDASTLEDAVDRGSDPSGLFADPVRALGLPVRAVSAEEARSVRVGAAIPAGDLEKASPGTPVAVADADRLYAVYEYASDTATLKPGAVLAGGVAR